MRAIRIHELIGLDALKLEDIPPPVPGPGEVHIRVHAAGTNFPDTLMIEGKYQHKPELPFTLGMEAAGEVIGLGHGAERFSLGDRVMGFFDYGAYAEEAAIKEDYLTPVPDGMDWATAASFALTHATSYTALAHPRVGLKAGEVLLVHGAAGGVGTTAVQCGKALGATVVATAGSDDKVAFALENGADYGINYGKEDIRERVKELVGGADVVLDPVGGDAFMASLRCINFEGRIVVIGFASGEIPKTPANYVLVKNISIVGFPIGAYRRQRPELIHQSYDRLEKLWAEGKLKPRISHTFPLEAAAEALTTMLERRVLGKIVVQISKEA